MEEKNMKKGGGTPPVSREIDVLKLLDTLLRERRVVALCCSVFFVIGVIVALNTQKLYTTTVVLAPESSGDGSMSGKLGSVTSMLGISLNGSAGSDAIYPQLYPNVFASTDFQVGLFNVPVTQQGESVSKPYARHLVYDGKIPFWLYPRVWFSQWKKRLEEGGKPSREIEDADAFALTKDQWKLCELIQSLVTCVVDKKTQVITLSVTDIDPFISASMADTVMGRLQTYMTTYRTKKARTDLAYISTLVEQSHKDYLEAQKAYAQATDSHQNLFLKAYQTKLENLENEMQIRYNVYAETSQQLQIARQRVQERTPVFTIIQGPTVPVKASSTPRLFIVLGYMVLGFFVAVVWVFGLRDWWRDRQRPGEEQPNVLKE